MMQIRKSGLFLGSVFSFCMLYSLSIPAQGLQAKLAISPPRLELEADQISKTQSITVLNLGAQDMEVNVSVQNWDLDENNKYRALPPNKQSLDQWIVINPVRITIPANSQQTVRMAIRPRASPENGEHRAMLFFEEKFTKRVDTKLQYSFKVGVPVYANFGAIERAAMVHHIRPNAVENQLEFDISNLGNVHLRTTGSYVVIDAKEYQSDAALLGLIEKVSSGDIDNVLAQGTLSINPVLPGQRRQLTQDIHFKTPPKSPYYIGLRATIADKVVEEVYKVEP